MFKVMDIVCTHCGPPIFLQPQLAASSIKIICSSLKISRMVTSDQNHFIRIDIQFEFISPFSRILNILIFNIGCFYISLYLFFFENNIQRLCQTLNVMLQKYLYDVHITFYNKNKLVILSC